MRSYVRAGGARQRRECSRRPEQNLEVGGVGGGSHSARAVLECERSVDQRPRVEFSRFHRCEGRRKPAASRANDGYFVHYYRSEVQNRARRGCALQDYGSARLDEFDCAPESVCVSGAIDQVVESVAQLAFQARGEAERDEPFELLRMMPGDDRFVLLAFERKR